MFACNKTFLYEKKINIFHILYSGCTLQVNPDMISQLETAGLSFVGKDETGRRMEVCIFA